jgi:HEAT repeat protein
MPTFTRRLLELLGDESPNVRSAASKALARIESIEKPLLNSTAADSIEIEESPEIPVSSVVDVEVGVEIDSSQASPEPLDDTSILKLNR